MCVDARNNARYDKPILLHVTADVFRRIQSGEKTHEYRPRTSYYMSRLEKVRDYISYMNAQMLSHHIYIDFRRAYEKSSPGNWLISRVKSISFIRLKDAPFELRKLYPKCMLEDWFYDIELDS